MSEKDNKEKDKKIKKLSEVSAENEANEKTFDKVVSIDKSSSKKDEKLTTLKDVMIEVDDARKKVKLDELVKKADSKEKEEKEKDKENTIVSVDFKKESKKKKELEAKADKEKAKQVKKDLKEIGGLKDEKAEAKKEEKKESKKEEINLDTLGVERAKEPIDVEKIIITTIIVMGSILVLLAALYFLPIFRVKEVNVSGLSTVSQEDIEKAIGYDKEKNLFILLMGGIKEKVLTIPEVKDVQYKLEGLRTLNIKVNEIRVAGYIPYLNEYVYIDSDGKVVDISREKREGIPLIEGLDFSSFSLGKLLDVSNEESLKIIIEVTNVLNKYDISSMIDSIDVNDSENISLFVGSIEVGIGTIEECDHKIRMAMEAIKNLEGAKGYLDVNSSNEKIYFKPIA
ncbi:MAG: FtsQ-type POTRA domain-containing protein [Clostridia bacterium]|nr:FtsQ-type POTRA domain-containing protein [Clostridia bacterium]